jgi:Ser/Thr protein kinase RdoA (MazF antagonist)
MTALAPPNLGAPRLGRAATRRLELLLGAPVELRVLKHKPGRRLTLAARGRRGSAVVKLYASLRAAVVAARVGALASGPVEPATPRVLHADPELHLVVLSWVPGSTLGRAVRRGDGESCRRAGAALGGWHRHWSATAPAVLAPHSLDRELAILHAAAARSAWPGARAAVARTPLPGSWEPRTVVHRDLYEEQILLDRRVGLIDLDDAALGPPELDVGNLLAHLDLLALGVRRDLRRLASTLLTGYQLAGPDLDPALVIACRRLTLLRLACVHAEPALAGLARQPGRG